MRRTTNAADGIPTSWLQLPAMAVADPGARARVCSRLGVWAWLPAGRRDRAQAVAVAGVLLVSVHA